MALRTELHLGRSHFQRNWKRTREEVRRGAREMKRETAGVGESLTAGFKGAAGKIAAVTGVGLGLTEIAQALQRSADESLRLTNMAAGLNEPIEAMLRLQGATRQLGMDFETVAEFSRELEDRLGDLGNDEPIEVLNRMGLEAEDLIAMPIDEKLLAIADAFETSRAEGVGYSDLLKLLGDSVGEQLLPMLARGREGIEALFEGAPDDQLAKDIETLSIFAERLNKVKGDALDLGKGLAADLIETNEFIVDLFSSGFDEDRASQKFQDRRNEARDRADQSVQTGQDKAAAIAASREEEDKADAIKEQAGAASELAGQLEKIAALEDDIRDAETSMLPEDQQLEVLKSKLQKIMQEATEGTIFDPTMRGLQSMADSGSILNEQIGSESGLRQAEVALETMKEAAAVQKSISDLEESIAAARQSDLEKLQEMRDKAEEGAFDLLSPEEQFEKMRDQLSESMGVDIRGSDDLTDGLTRLRDEVKLARESGDMEAERIALERLNEAQEEVQEFRGLSDQLAEAQPAPAELSMGSVGQLYSQLFNLDPQEKQLRTLDDIRRDQRERLDLIIEKMDENPEIRFDSFD